MRIRIHPSFWLYLISIAFLASPMQCLCICIALFVHEFAHYAAAYVMGERFSRMEITPFGGVMLYENGKAAAKGLKGAATAAAGPLGNYICILILSTIGSRYPDISPQLLSSGITANAVMMVFNLLPALPLDGGRIVFCFGYYLFSVSRLATILTAAGVVLGVCMLCLSLIAAAKTGSLNVSLLFIGIYLAVHAVRSRNTLISENIYVIVQERLSGSRRMMTPVKLYHISTDVPLHALIKPILNAESAAFVFEHDGRNCMVGEGKVLRQLLINPTVLLSELVPDFR